MLGETAKNKSFREDIPPFQGADEDPGSKRLLHLLVQSTDQISYDRGADGGGEERRGSKKELWRMEVVMRKMKGVRMMMEEVTAGEEETHED